MLWHSTGVRDRLQSKCMHFYKGKRIFSSSRLHLADLASTVCLSSFASWCSRSYTTAVSKQQSIDQRRLQTAAVLDLVPGHIHISKQYQGRALMGLQALADCFKKCFGFNTRCLLPATMFEPSARLGALQ